MSQINISQLARAKVQPMHFECKIVEFNKLWCWNVSLGCTPNWH